DALRTVMSDTPTEPEPEPETPVDPEAPAEPQTVPVEPAPAEPAPDTTEEESVTPVETITPTEVIQPVAASTSPARRAAANAVPPQLPARRTEVATLAAAADVPGIPTGAPLDGLTAACDALLRRMRGFPTTRVGGADGVMSRYGAALIQKHGFDDLTQDNKDLDDYALVWAAGSEARLPGGSLVAAGGWCAPSETLYDLCQFESVEGLLSIPEMQITRGGIRWTQGPDFSDIYNACGFFLSNAEAEAGVGDKNCCIVECPPFEEIRLEAIGLCVRAPLLTQAAYPELVRRFMEGALVAHQHKVNKYIIDQIDAAAGASGTVADVGSLTLNLEAINFVAVGMRERHRLGMSTTIEVVAPWYLRTLWIADLGMRQFSPASAEAYINSWFSDRNLSVQWVFDFQSLDVDGCAVTFPDSVRVLLYPAGTWVKGSLDVINIDAVYDSTGLEQNVYTALFMEEGILAVQRCTHTCALDIPICVSGRAAANDITECLAVSAGSTTGGGSTEATGATAGTPGSFTPSGSTAPDNLNDIQSNVTASPATAWTTGQRVVLGDGSEAHWDGTAWQPGRVA
ncbi:MAG TPA: major capsid protein, partial [Acidimicrobiales bacterium]